MFIDWTKDGVDEDEETPVQLQLDAGTFAAEMEAKGVGTDRPVVVKCPISVLPTHQKTNNWNLARIPQKNHLAALHTSSVFVLLAQIIPHAVPSVPLAINPEQCIIPTDHSCMYLPH